MIPRRCLICSNLNPCARHTMDDQDRELDRNMAIEQEARELLAQIHEAAGNNPAAFTLRNVGAVGKVLEAQVAVVTGALARQARGGEEEKECVMCANATGWYTSHSGGVAHEMPCDYCNAEGLPPSEFVASGMVSIRADVLQRLRDEREKFMGQVRDTCARGGEEDLETLRSALGPLARNGGYYKPDAPHFAGVEVPLEYLRRARDAYTQVFGREPPSFEEERAPLPQASRPTRPETIEECAAIAVKYAADRERIYGRKSQYVRAALEIAAAIRALSPLSQKGDG